MFSNGVSLADIAAVTGNNRDNDGMWGNGAWWIVILLIFGWGGFGNNGCGNGNGMGSTAAAYTDSAIQRGFDNQAVISKLDGITNGLCDGFYAANNSMLTGFNGINTNTLAAAENTKKIKDNTEEMTVSLDTGQVVGAIAPDMYDALGRIRTQKGRGN